MECGPPCSNLWTIFSLRLLILAYRLFKFKTYFIYPIYSALRRVERLLSNIYTNYDTLTAPPDLWRNMFLMLESTQLSNFDRPRLHLTILPFWWN